MNALELLLAALAVYRLTRLTVSEAGPGEVLIKLRQWVCCQARMFGGFWRFADELINCEYCISVWWAALVGVFVIVPGWFSAWVLVWLGLAGAFCAMQEIKDRS